MKCLAAVAMCFCRHDADHEGPHECYDREKCDGAWEDRFGPFESIRPPGGLIMLSNIVTKWEAEI